MSFQKFVPSKNTTCNYINNSNAKNTNYIDSNYEQFRELFEKANTINSNNLMPKTNLKSSNVSPLNNINNSQISNYSLLTTAKTRYNRSKNKHIDNNISNITDNISEYSNDNKINSNVSNSNNGYIKFNNFKALKTSFDSLNITKSHSSNLIIENYQTNNKICRELNISYNSNLKNTISTIGLDNSNFKLEIAGKYNQTSKLDISPINENSYSYINNKIVNFSKDALKNSNFKTFQKLSELGRDNSFSNITISNILNNKSYLNNNDTNNYSNNNCFNSIKSEKNKFNDLDLIKNLKLLNENDSKNNRNYNLLTNNLNNLNITQFKNFKNNNILFFSKNANKIPEYNDISNNISQINSKETFSNNYNSNYNNISVSNLTTTTFNKCLTLMANRSKNESIGNNIRCNNESKKSILLLKSHDNDDRPCSIKPECFRKKIKNSFCRYMFDNVKNCLIEANRPELFYQLPSKISNEHKFNCTRDFLNMSLKEAFSTTVEDKKADSKVLINRIVLNQYVSKEFQVLLNKKVFDIFNEFLSSSSYLTEVKLSKVKYGLTYTKLYCKIAENYLYFYFK